MRSRQYTIRNVPSKIDSELRNRARTKGKSLNEIALEALCLGAGVEYAAQFRDLEHLIGKWVEDPEFDRAIAEQDVIDEELWR